VLLLAALQFGSSGTACTGCTHPARSSTERAAEAAFTPVVGHGTRIPCTGHRAMAPIAQRRKRPRKNSLQKLTLNLYPQHTSNTPSLRPFRAPLTPVALSSRAMIPLHRRWCHLLGDCNFLAAVFHTGSIKHTTAVIHTDSHESDNLHWACKEKNERRPPWMTINQDYGY